MAATTDRQAARERLRALMEKEIDRLIPADDSVPLKGQVFADFEDQSLELERKLCPAFLEERVKLSDSSHVEAGGVCPFCKSTNVRLEKRESKVDLITPQGVLPMTQQHARCRSCDRTFSPSGS
jgi:hypothetical protein